MKNSLNIHICPAGYKVTIIYQDHTIMFNLLDITNERRIRSNYISYLFHWGLGDKLLPPPAAPQLKSHRYE